MNFFNEIDKVSYNKETEDPIKLIEYINFMDEHEKEKYILFKFKNYLNQKASSIKVEVRQYDNNDNLIEKTIFSYSNFNANPQEVFVPAAKLKVNFNTSYIDVKLLFATFESLEWNGEKLVPKMFTGQDFKEEYSTKPVNSNNKKINPYKNQQSPYNGSNKTKYKDTTKINKPRLPKFVTILLSLILIGVSVFAVFKFRSESKYLHDEQYEYEILNKSQVKIINYLGNKIDITIPSKYSKYNVSLVDKEAFKEANISKIKFEKGNISISISANAFEGCKMLTEINDTYGTVSSVAMEAFKDCNKLTSVNLPNASIQANAFSGCSSVKNFACNDFLSGSIYSAFNTKISITTLQVNQTHITKNFFADIFSIDSLTLGGVAYMDEDSIDSVGISKLRIGKNVTVSPQCLVKCKGLMLELNKDNKYKTIDYLNVNSTLIITTWIDE